MSSRKRFFEDRVVSLYSVRRGHRSYLRRREFFTFTPFLPGEIAFQSAEKIALSPLARPLIPAATSDFARRTPSPSDGMGSEEEEIEERPWRQLLRHTVHAENGPPQITLRAVLTGLLVGSLLCGRHVLEPCSKHDHAHPDFSPTSRLVVLNPLSLIPLLSPPMASSILSLHCRVSPAGPCCRSCFTNMYFGLQTGWVTMGSIQSALIGYGIFQLPWRMCSCLGGGRGRPFGPLENVVVQTVSVATATLPLAGGFIGIIPALGMLDPPVVLSTGQMLAWAAALTYFGICFAVPLRRQTILVEKLTFPSGTATAKLIQLLHGGALPTGTALDAYSSIGSPGGPRGVGGGGGVTGGVGGRDRYACDDAEYDDDGEAGEAMMSGLASEAPWRVLGLSFGASFGLSALVYLTLPSADPTLHIFSWIGLPSFTTWRWTLRPALSFVGQGARARSAPARSAPAQAVVLCLCLSRPLSRPLALSLPRARSLSLSPAPSPSNPLTL